MSTLVALPTEMLVRYRATDREEVGSALVDTPAHLSSLEEDIAENGLETPLELGVNEHFATLDGNHRLAIARRLGFATVPVRLTAIPAEPRPDHARDMNAEDWPRFVTMLGG
ncbi:MAG: hypothetical protein Q4G40_01815 [Brachybacterium sp.]|nr:hypothetical protein [Brachybacterium sp.]